MILALDLYFRSPRARMSADNPEIVELSSVLRTLPIHIDRPDPVRFRNPNGVYMKLANFASIDPAYGKAGLSRNNRLERVVWDEFTADQARLHEIAAAIRKWSGASALDSFSLLPVADEYEAFEGRILFRQHIARERNVGLVRKKKQLALSLYGRLACEVCEFEFTNRYGEIGSGFIECHHTRPIHSMDPGAKTRLSDLALVCANCHRMLHSGGITRTIDELRKCLRTNRY